MVATGILGTGAALPEKVITNSDLEKMVDTSDKWITERTGIKERRQAAPGETTSSLSVQAAKKALEMAGIKPKQLDLIICSTISPDMPLPATASIIPTSNGWRRPPRTGASGPPTGPRRATRRRPSGRAGPAVS